MMRIILMTCLLIVMEGSYAVTIPDAKVLYEANNGVCNISNSPLVAAVESVLRQNGIKINKYSHFAFYINVGGYAVENECVVSVSLTVYTNQLVKIRDLQNKEIFGRVVLCEERALLSGPSYSITNKINDELRSYSEQCVSEIEKIEFERF